MLTRKGARAWRLQPKPPATGPDGEDRHVRLPGAHGPFIQ